MTSVVVHYKELALKGRNRPWFVQALLRNIRSLLADLDVDDLADVHTLFPTEPLEAAA